MVFREIFAMQKEQFRAGAQRSPVVVIEIHTGSFEMHRITDRENESVRNCTRETITRHVSDRSYDFSLRRTGIMYSQPLTRETSSAVGCRYIENANENKRLGQSSPRSPRYFTRLSVISAKLPVWKVKRPAGTPYVLDALNNASARKDRLL